MTQANATATIETFLKSRYKNPITGRLDGLAVDDNGDFLHPNTIILQTFDELFKDMTLTIPIDNAFKIEFCKKFYFREIGQETFARFLLMLESTLETDCRNFFKIRQHLLSKTPDDLNLGYESNSSSSSSGDNQGLGLSNLTPHDRLDITFTEKYGVIEYADALQENHGKFENQSDSKTSGWSGSSLADRYFSQATLPDITALIFITCEPLFLQYFS